MRHRLVAAIALALASGPLALLPGREAGAPGGGTVWAAPAEVAVVREVRGQVFVRRARRPLLQVAGSSERLLAGDALLTGSDGSATVRVGARDVRVGPSSELKINPASRPGSGLLALLKALFADDGPEVLTAGAGVRAGKKALRVLAPRGPIAEPSPVIRWEGAGGGPFRVELGSGSGLSMGWTVSGNELALAGKQVRLVPGRYYVVVEAQGSPPGRATVWFDVAEPVSRP